MRRNNLFFVKLLLTVVILLAAADYMAERFGIDVMETVRHAAGDETHPSILDGGAALIENALDGVAGGKDCRILFSEAVENRSDQVRILKNDWDEELYGPWEDAFTVIWNWANDTPEYFFLDSESCEMAAFGKDDSYIYYEFSFKYFTELDNAEAQAAIDAKTLEILGQIPDSSSDWEKARIIHDALIGHITYAETAYDQTIYGALVEGRCVCNGYALAYEYLLGKAGISCETVTGFSDSENAKLSMDVVQSSYATAHAWSLVTLKDPAGASHTSFIDVTWDDFDLKDDSGNDYIRYDWFGVSLDDIKNADRSGFPAFYHLEDYTYDDYINYHAHTGNLVRRYDLSTITALMKAQLAKGETVLTVRFTDRNEYYRAQEAFEKTDDASRLITDLGLHQAAYSFSDNKYGVGVQCLTLQ